MRQYPAREIGEASIVRGGVTEDSPPLAAVVCGGCHGGMGCFVADVIERRK